MPASDSGCWTFLVRYDMRCWPHRVYLSYETLLTLLDSPADGSSASTWAVTGQADTDQGQTFSATVGHGQRSGPASRGLPKPPTARSFLFSHPLIPPQSLLPSRHRGHSTGCWKELRGSGKMQGYQENTGDIRVCLGRRRCGIPTSQGLWSPGIVRCAR